MTWDDLTPSQREFVLSELRDGPLRLAKHRRENVRYNDDVGRDRAAAETFAIEKAIERLEGHL